MSNINRLSLITDERIRRIVIRKIPFSWPPIIEGVYETPDKSTKNKRNELIFYSNLKIKILSKNEHSDYDFEVLQSNNNDLAVGSIDAGDVNFYILNMFEQVIEEVVYE